MTEDRIRRDFDEIARLEAFDSGSGHYDAFLISLVKPDAARVLDVGCGKGRLTLKAASKAAGGSFDCILSAAALHHMKSGPALERMVTLLTSGRLLHPRHVREAWARHGVGETPHRIGRLAPRVGPSAWRACVPPLGLAVHHRLGQARRRFVHGFHLTSQWRMWILHWHV